MKDSELCRACIEHYEKMLVQAKKFPPENKSDHRIMEKTIGETWHYYYCILCKCYIAFNKPCYNCPLYKINQYCSMTNSAWREVANSETWMDWIYNVIFYMIPTLKKAEDYCLIEEKRNEEMCKEEGVEENDGEKNNT